MHMCWALCQAEGIQKGKRQRGSSFKELTNEQIIWRLMNTSKDKYSELWALTWIWRGLGYMDLIPQRMHRKSLKGGIWGNSIPDSKNCLCQGLQEELSSLARPLWLGQRERESDHSGPFRPCYEAVLFSQGSKKPLVSRKLWSALTWFIYIFLNNHFSGCCVKHVLEEGKNGDSCLGERWYKELGGGVRDDIQVWGLSSWSVDTRGGAGLWAHWGASWIWCPVYPPRGAVKSVMSYVSLEPGREDSTGHRQHIDGKWS